MNSRHQSFNDTIFVVDDLHSQIPFDNKDGVLPLREEQDSWWCKKRWR